MRMSLKDMRKAAQAGRLRIGVMEGKDGQYEMSVDPLADAVAWAKHNPLAYQQMVDWAWKATRAGHKPSTKLYIEILRAPYLAHELGLSIRAMDKQVKIKNALSSGLARLIERENPHIVFPKGKAKVDSWS